MYGDSRPPASQVERPGEIGGKPVGLVGRRGKRPPADGDCRPAGARQAGEQAAADLAAGAEDEDLPFDRVAQLTWVQRWKSSARPATAVS
jgi:hypothetical protein